MAPACRRKLLRLQSLAVLGAAALLSAKAAAETYDEDYLNQRLQVLAEEEFERQLALADEDAEEGKDDEEAEAEAPAAAAEEEEKKEEEAADTAAPAKEAEADEEEPAAKQPEKKPEHVAAPGVPKFPAPIPKKGVPAGVSLVIHDLDPEGDCGPAIASLCKSTEPGEGRFARCVRSAMSAAKARQDTVPVGAACRRIVRNFFVWVALEGSKPNPTISIDPVEGLRLTCRKDIDTLCDDASSKAVFTCLKDKKTKLSPACRHKVQRMQAHESADIDLDVDLSQACKDDLEICPNTTLPGARVACLRMNKKSLTEDCTAALFKRDKHDLEDIRLNLNVLQTCSKEVKKRCADVEAGEARILECLWSQMHTRSVDPFDPACKAKVEKLTEQSLSDYRLDFQVRTSCASDITNLCYKEKEEVDSMSIKNLFSADLDVLFAEENPAGSVLHCLKEKSAEVKSPRCQVAVQRMVRVEAMQFGTDVKVMSACHNDVENWCPDSRREEIHTCLRMHMNDLSYQCRAEELLQGALESTDVRLKPQIFYTCKTAMDKFCRDVAPGASEMLHCLQDHRADAGFPAKCKTVVVTDMQANVQDYRLNTKLVRACKREIHGICKDFEEEGGKSMLECLSSNVKTITTPACHKQVKRYIRQGGENIHLSPQKRAKCESDILQFCTDVEPGTGSIHACLMEHRHEISKECANFEFDKTELEHSDISFSSIAEGKCKADITKYCKDTRSGEGRVWKCLEDNMDEDLSLECKSEVKKHMKLNHANFFLDSGLTKHCQADAKKLCAQHVTVAASKSFASRGALVACMIENRAKIGSHECKQAMHRMQQQRVQRNVLDPVAKEVCQADVQRVCPDEKEKGSGHVQKCLQENLKDLATDCQHKIHSYLVLASEDIRFKKSLMAACATALKTHCADVQIGEGRQVNCLLRNMEEADIDSNCQEHLADEAMWRAKNIEYNPQMKKNCNSDLLKLFETKKCQSNDVAGSKILCLSRHINEISKASCKYDVRQNMKRQSADVRNVPTMMQECKGDIDALCPGKAAGEGRVHECLRDQKSQVQSAKCYEIITEIEERAKNSATLNYNVRKKCRSETRRFCKDVEAGDSKILACLGLHRKEAGFSEGCTKALVKTELEKAIAKHPVQAGMDELKKYLSSHRGFFDKYGLILLAGTAGCVVMTGFVISFVVIRNKLWTPYNQMTVDTAAD